MLGEIEYQIYNSKCLPPDRYGESGSSPAKAGSGWEARGLLGYRGFSAPGVEGGPRIERGGFYRLPSGEIAVRRRELTDAGDCGGGVVDQLHPASRRRAPVHSDHSGAGGCGRAAARRVEGACPEIRCAILATARRDRSGAALGCPITSTQRARAAAAKLRPIQRGLRDALPRCCRQAFGLAAPLTPRTPPRARCPTFSDEN